MLTPDKVRYENGVKINEKIIPDSARASRAIASWVPKGGKMKPGLKMKPIGVTMHNTNDLAKIHDDAEQYTRATWPNCNMAGVAVHYYVDDTCAWQNLEEDEQGWHAADGFGPGNTQTIAIECIMDGSGSKEDLGARDNAARLAASILKRHGWTIDNLYTHNHWMGQPDKIAYGVRKNCPIFLLPKWEEFKNLVKFYLQNGNKEAPVETQKPASATSGLTFNDIKVGDILNFKGTEQYVASGLTQGIPAKPGKVKVTKKYVEVAKHPILVRSVDDSGKFISGVFGWVNIEDLELDIKLPYLVRVTADTKIYSDSSDKNVAAIIKKGTYTIIQQENGFGLLKSKAGWIPFSDTEKI